MDTSRPSLKALAYVLRHPDTWPKGFEWDNTRLQQGSVGLLVKLWGGPGFNVDNALILNHLAVMLKTSPDIASRLFLSEMPYCYRILGVPVWPRSRRAVTPEIAALAVDNVMAQCLRSSLSRPNM